MTHEIKLNKEFADAVFKGEKPFEIRFNDRGYQRGDYIKFQVMDGMFRENHPLNDILFEITYVLNGWGLQDGYVALGIKKKEQ